MKATLQSIIDNDTTYNKSATRYLYKNHPELWQQIVEATNFLLEDAKAKQRVWHILNDVYERPTCPITGEFVKWHENRYLKTKDVAAAGKLQYQEGRTAFGTPELEKRRIASMKKAIAEGRRKLPTLTEEAKQARVEKIKQTCLERYGVTNGSKTLKARKKISDKQIENGATPKSQRTDRRKYYDSVWYFTEQSWKEHFDDINPESINRSKNALDHIYSIQQGFRDNIPPYIVGHWTNLRVIPLNENSKKGMRCDKTKEQLFNDFFLHK